MHTKKSFLTLISFLVFFLYFTAFGILLPFLASVPLNNGGFQTLSAQADLYKMIDTFYDPDEFYDFRSSTENINILSDFYNQLDASDDFDVLTSCKQPIEVANFKGDESFYYNSEDFLSAHPFSYANIKSLQLNQKAYQFYKIETDNGAELFWDDISYEDAHVPVFLGSDYKKYYRLGDVIRGNYYNKMMDFEVVGFLKEHCSVTYRNIADLDLDTYLLLPYPPHLWEVHSDFQFESILYFAMINCDILPLVNKTQLIKTVKEIADSTGFTDFSFVGIDRFQIQHADLLFFTQKHSKSIIFMLAILFLVINIIGVKIFRSIIQAGAPGFFQKGDTRCYAKLFAFHVILPYGIAFLCGALLCVIFLKKFLPVISFFKLLALLLTYSILYIFSRKTLTQ